MQLLSRIEAPVLLCKGQRPGTSIDGDWRIRGEHRELWTELFRHVEERLVSRGVSGGEFLGGYPPDA